MECVGIILCTQKSQACSTGVTNNKNIAVRLPTGKVASQICKHSTILYAPAEMKVSRNGGMNFISLTKNDLMYKLGV